VSEAERSLDTETVVERNELARRLLRAAPGLLVLLVVVVYLPSLSGGFLNWDDPWLIEQNPILREPSLRALGAIWTDFRLETRLVLGAEYLPIRDTSLWLEARLWGLDPQWLRVTNLLFYIAAVLAFRAALLRTLSRAAAEAAAFVFAIHPVHVESVAWLASRKDVLALAFVGLALYLHAGEGRRRFVLVPLSLLLAHLSKSMTVVALGLLAAQDLMKRRKPEPALYAAALAAAAVAVVVHILVGSRVGMVGAPAGGSHGAALLTMGPVWLRYLRLLVLPQGALSIVHDVPIRTSVDAAVLAGYALPLAWAVFGAWSMRRKRAPLVLASFLFFAVPLLPVSQVLFPLQNLMADRYLYLSAMAPALIAAFAVLAWPKAGVAVSVGWIAVASATTIGRASLFADSEAVFRDAVRKTERSPIAPYQLGEALEARGDDEAAIEAYREVLRRAPGREEATRRATNNLAKLLARKGKLAEAEQLLRRGRTLFPDDPKMLENLARVVSRQGRSEEAEELRRDGARPPAR